MVSVSTSVSCPGTTTTTRLRCAEAGTAIDQTAAAIRGNRGLRIGCLLRLVPQHGEDFGLRGRVFQDPARLGQREIAMISLGDLPVGHNPSTSNQNPPGIALQLRYLQAVARAPWWALNLPAAGRNPQRGREAERRAGSQSKRALRNAVAEGMAAQNRRAIMILERSGDHFGSACGPRIDQHRERQ